MSHTGLATHCNKRNILFNDFSLDWDVLSLYGKGYLFYRSFTSYSLYLGQYQSTYGNGAFQCFVVKKMEERVVTKWLPVISSVIFKWKQLLSYNDFPVFLTSPGVIFFYLGCVRKFTLAIYSDFRALSSECDRAQNHWWICELSTPVEYGRCQ
jgi:hypothetical protein